MAYGDETGWLTIMASTRKAGGGESTTADENMLGVSFFLPFLLSVFPSFGPFCSHVLLQSVPLTDSGMWGGDKRGKIKCKYRAAVRIYFQNISLFEVTCKYSQSGISRCVSDVVPVSIPFMGQLDIRRPLYREN